MSRRPRRRVIREEEKEQRLEGGEHFDAVQGARARRFGISLDWWAVIVAVTLALLVVVGVIPSVPW
jgi:multidrug efflux pump subunit AcrB